MSRNIGLRASAIVVCSIAVLCSPVVARAQVVDAFDPGADTTVWAMAVQPDGKILVGGGFTHLGGGTGVTLRNHIGRLNVDGTVDSTFNPGTNGPVQAIAVQPDGKILAAGNFNAAGGGTGVTAVRQHIARFNADGTVDSTFNPGANNNIYALIVQPDGKILVGGEFSLIGGGGTGTIARNRLARLNPDGTPDSFDPGVSKPSASAIVYTMALQADGKVVVGGYFNGLGGSTGSTVRNFIGRINADGTLDTGFDPGATSIVNALAIQSDGKILVGGSFTGLGNGTGTTLRQNIGRLNVDGSVDGAFNPGAEAQVLTLGVQTDGKILLGGYFKWLGAAGGPARSTRNYIGRLNLDGSVDGTWDPGAQNVVNGIAVQGDGSILAVGIFNHVGGGSVTPPGGTTLRNGIARFLPNNAAVQTLTLTGNGTIETWMRGGSTPEVTYTTFEFSFDGSFYSMLGNGARIAGGWQLNSVNLPSTRTVYLRARGYYGTGFQNGSGSIVEQILILLPTLQSRRLSDFDGDGKADIAIYRPSTGTWWVLQSTAGYVATPFGISTDIPVPGDYDGDGVTDIAVFRPSIGRWYINRSSAGISVQDWGVSTDRPVPADYDGDGKTDLAVFRPSSGTWFILKSSDGTFTATPWGVSTDVPVPADYDGDGKSDIAAFRPSSGTWFILKSSDGTFTATAWGISTDVPVTADYDGDGKSDLAVFRPSNGTWFILKSSDLSFTATSWGLSTDVPVPADYDGDGKTDVAIFRPSTGTWYLLQSTAGYMSVSWGTSTDTPVLKRLSAQPPRATIGDFDGDRKADLTVFRPSSGTWFTLKSGENYTAYTSTPFGLAGDIPVPGDYDGDGKADIAVFRSGAWYILKSSDSTFSAQPFGLAGDIPVPGDYDGDGQTDVAIFRPSTGTWYLLQSTAGYMSVSWGTSTDTPVPADYDGDGKTDVAIFRPSTGTWYLLQSTAGYMSVSWGTSTDTPVPADYDGDGKTDVAIFRPSTGTWYLLQSTAGYMSVSWGTSTDTPVAGDYDGDGKTDVAVFRPSSGTWFQLLSGSNYTSSASYPFGQSGDIPILQRP